MSVLGEEEGGYRGTVYRATRSVLPVYALTARLRGGEAVGGGLQRGGLDRVAHGEVVHRRLQYIAIVSI